MKNGNSNIKTITVASRPSPLAKEQVQEIARLLPHVSFEIKLQDSLGDKDRGTDLMSSGVPQDFFTREIDQMVVTGAADLAIHSAKDLPESLPAGLGILAITEGKTPTDSLVGPQGYSLETLPSGAKVGTSSLRRKTQLLEIRPDLIVVPIRGNIQDRIGIAQRGEVDAVVVATCALERLGLDQGSVLPFITHPLQGFLALIGRTDNLGLRALCSPLDARKKWGKVSLVGAGPGDPALITLKGRALLEQADQIFYDALLDPRQIQGLKAKLTYVGKRQGDHSYSQDKIQDLMIRAAQAGSAVVRLKGGDPFIYGRGGEEVLALREARLDYQVVPGVSSALGAAAYLDLPLTQRHEAATLAFSMGYPTGGIEVLDVDSQAMFMGRSNISRFAQLALDKGRAPEAKLVLVENATWPQQRRIVLSLAEAQEYQHDSKEPVLVILTKSADSFTGPSWFERQDKVLYTGTDPDKYKGPGQVFHYPVIEIGPREVDSSALERILGYDWLIFTSKYGVEHFFDHWYASGKDCRDLAGLRVLSIGEVTSHHLKNRGLVPDVQAQIPSSPGVVYAFSQLGLKAQRVLIPSSELALPIIPQGLRDQGHTVDRLYVYSSSIPRERAEIQLDWFDRVVFSSPSCVDNFFALFTGIPHSLLFEPQGPTTAARLQKVLEKRALNRRT
jgi:uroporphyrinogen III methyltransferase/synthase